jgi:hypothetical protein
MITFLVAMAAIAVGFVAGFLAGAATMKGLALAVLTKEFGRKLAASSPIKTKTLGAIRTAGPQPEPSRAA